MLIYYDLQMKVRGFLMPLRSPLSRSLAPQDTLFEENVAVSGGALMLYGSQEFLISNCTFRRCVCV